jgi:hypothetical protein
MFQVVTSTRAIRETWIKSDARIGSSGIMETITAGATSGESRRKAKSGGSQSLRGDVIAANVP